MVAAPLILEGDLKMLDQIIGGDLSKKLNWGGGGTKFLGGGYEHSKGGHITPFSRSIPLS